MYVMDRQGYNSQEELLMASQDGFDTMVKNAIRAAPPGVNFALVAIRKLNTFKYWAEEQDMCGLALAPNLFTADVLNDYLRLLRSDEIEVAAKKDQKPTLPDVLKHEKGWFKFWENVKNYLGQKRGAAKVPLSYVVREHEEVTAAIRNAEYDSHTKKVSVLLLLSGQHFKVDNESVWETVKSLVIDGFGWNYIKRYDRSMDGRAAVLAWRRQCEGKTSINMRKNKAYLSISGSSYKGHRKAFTFAQYLTIHQAAHNELEDCDEPMPETRKVSDFIAGISDAGLEAGITCVLSDDRYSDDFEATQQFLGTLVANQAIHRQGKRGGNEDRKVASSSSGGAKGGGKSKKNKRKIEARFYSNAEWSKLTPEERTQVIELKKKAKEEGKSSTATGKRKTSATGSSERDEAHREGDDETEEAEPLPQGGNEFGRGAHKKKKVTISAATRIEPTRATQRNVMAIGTIRRVMDTSNASIENGDDEGRVELDTHADTCVAGSNTVVLELTGKVVSVSPFCDSQYQSIEDVPVATVATAYDCPVTGKVHILVINEALYFGEKMKNTLLCPNQLRANGVQVHDCPKQYDPLSRHSVYVQSNDLEIPLSMRGVISGFTTRIPTQAELDDFSTHVELTSEKEWDPYSIDFSATEETHNQGWKERGGDFIGGAQ